MTVRLILPLRAFYRVGINVLFSSDNKVYLQRLVRPLKNMKKRKDIGGDIKTGIHTHKQNLILKTYSASIAAGGTAGGLSALGFVPGAFVGAVAGTYWQLLASRMDAHDKGKGVIVSVTWALFFSVKTR
ncbi:MAG: hypothetical protein SOI41_09240 [Heyndrickxia coagulans]|uniref:hypothetical protein n=1 Tax=Heyndrickxia coagulans TaxID=1398 RepID=UPI00128FBE38|nr:hypothetical protein [Heyndrickxia coagulans]